MVLKRFAALFILTVLTGFPLFASTISFMVIETGKGEGRPVSEYSRTWETGLMNAFFDAGHIVSNAPILQLKQKPADELGDEIQTGINEAAEGGADYFVLAFLHYTAGDGSARPQDVSLRLFTVSPPEMIFEKQFAAAGGSAGSSGKGSASKDDSALAAANAEKAAQTIISYIKDR